MTISYHSGDNYANSSASTRSSFYGVSGTPTVKLDGDFGIVGGEATGNMYPAYRAYFDTHKSVPSVLDFDLACTYDSASRTGQLSIKIRNTSGSAVSGQLQVALCENHIYYHWGNLDSLHHVERNMLPSASGEAVSIPANDSITKTRDFTIDPTWVARNCELVVFVQNNSSKAMYQGARIGVYQVPALEYRGYQSAFPEPGGDASLTVGLRNLGSGDASTVSATLSTSDPYVSVTTPGANFGDITVGQDVYSQTPFAIHVDAGCPNDHLATMNLAVTGAGGYVTSLSFPVNVSTNRGLTDDFESGVNGWTHSGILDNWHQTTHRNQSPTHSWYPGVENSWQYTNENDTRLVTPWFTSGDSAQLSFDHWYNVEVDYDYCLPEVNNGSKFWVPLASYTGASSNWQHVTFPLAGWSGQTLRCAFRFISDPGTVAEGWYVDNFRCEPLVTGISENRDCTALGTVPASATIANRQSQISYAVPAGTTACLAAYDVNGRQVATLASHLTGTGRVAWDLARVKAGTYFIRLTGGATGSVTKVVVAK